MAYTYKEFVRYMTMLLYTVCFSYKGILYLECQLYTDYTAVVGVYLVMVMVRRYA